MNVVLNPNKETLVGLINYGNRGPKGEDGLTVVAVNTNNDGSITFVYNDGTEFTTDPLHITESADWADVTNKPFSSLGSNLIVSNGVLDVNTTNEAIQDNTQPITSGGVQVIVGNIEVLLQTI